METGTLRITGRMVAALQAALQGGAVSATAETDAERYHVGAVWYGNWRDDADGGRFGSEAKPRHNACIARKNPSRTRFTLHPITSERKVAPGVISLPRGMIPGQQLVVSYVLTQFRLMASRATLEERFEYRCSLPADYVQRMKEIAAR